MLSILTFLVGVITTLFTLLYRNNREKQREQDIAIKELRNFIGQVPKEYVSKDDFSRVVTPLEKKVDDVNEKLAKLSNELIDAIGKLSIQIAQLVRGEKST